MDERLMYRREFFIGGGWAGPAGGERLGVVSPSTEEVVGEVPVATAADIDRAVGAAWCGRGTSRTWWRSTRPAWARRRPSGCTTSPAAPTG